MMAANKREEEAEEREFRTNSIRDDAENNLARTPKRGHDLTGQTPEELIHELIPGVKR